MSWKQWFQDHILTLLAIAIIVGTWALSGKWTALQPEYGVMVGAVLALVGIHKTDETAYDYLQKKADNSTQEDPATKA